MKINNFNNIKLAPSLIVARRTSEKTFDFISQSNNTLNFYIPETFLNLILNDILHIRHPVFRFFVEKAYPEDLRFIKALIEKNNEKINSFKIQKEYQHKYETFIRSLKMILAEQFRFSYEEESIYKILNILLEEWIFLNEKSILISRLRKTFRIFNDAGAVCIQFGKKTVDMAIRRTLKKKENELIDKIDKLRAIAKWIAVGGLSLEPLFETIHQVVGSGILGFFLLFAPENKINSQNIFIHGG
ncbi:MAG: hypothetical protein QXY62_05985 [Candidatus Altiarchaeota archaeon]